MCALTLLYRPQTDGLCSSDGVIIQTVTSDSASSDALDQTQLVVETPGRGQEEQLEATSLLEGVTETQEPMTDGFGDKVGPQTCFYSERLSRLLLSLCEFCVLVRQELSSSSVEVPVVHSGSTVLIVSPPNISSTLTGNGSEIIPQL